MSGKVSRCAVYTRKSSEEGLDQSFNSLDAQREACEAYIKSQANEGWKLVKTAYDDGGFSGGSMDRPALRRLLADLGGGLVDIIVVYKIDRLTRSLADFARIVETLDQQGLMGAQRPAQRYEAYGQEEEHSRECQGKAEEEGARGGQGGKYEV